MPIQQNLNVSPYFDDFDVSKNYYKTLFRPGFPIQARELTSMQTAIADQIEQFASKFMVPGDTVTPGEFGFANPVAYVKIRSTTSTNIEDFVGYTLTGITSGVSAKVLFVAPATKDDAITFFVSYTSAGNTQVSNTFQEGEILSSDSPGMYTAVVGVSGIDKPVESPAMGFGCLFTVNNGSYYVNGYMVRNYDQTIVISKYSTTPTTQVGFLVTESFVSANEDVSLLDNAQGSSNFAAPGADRLKIELNLAKLDIDSTVPNFIRLATIIQGNLQGSPNQTIKWDWLFDILARRTFNESGDYIVKDFNVQPLEYPNTEELDGLFDPTDVSGIDYYPPVPGSDDTDLITYDEADGKYVLNVSSGLAYVNGYEVGFDSSLYVFGEKARTTGFRDNASINVTEGAFFYVSRIYGAPDVQNITSNGDAIGLSDIILYRNFTDGYTGDSVITFPAPGGGTLDRPQNIGNKPQTTYHIICDSIVPQTPYTEVYRAGNSVVVSGDNLNLSRGDLLGTARILAITTIPALPVGVMTPKYFQPSDRVGSSTFYEYSSEYKLGINNVQYFTHLSVLSDSNTPWVVGQYVTGDDSGAYAIVEDGSINDFNGYSILVLSNVVGEFVPGEDIFQGTKAGTLFRTGEVVGFTFTDSGISGSNVFDLSGETAVVVSVLGASTTVTVADGEIIATPSEIKLTEKGRTKILGLTDTIASDRRRRLNYTAVTVPNSVSGYVTSPAVNIKNSTSTTKSFYSSLSGVNDFSADISGQIRSHSESLVIAQGGLFTGSATKNYLTCNNFSGDPSEELRFGDIISFVDDTGLPITKQVLFTTEPSGYGAQRTPSFVYFTTALENDVTGKQIERIRAKKFGNASDNLIYQLPQQVIKSLETAPLSTDIRYQAFREFYVPYNSGSTNFSITTSNSNEEFLGSSQNTTIVVAQNISATDLTLEGRFINPVSIQSQDAGKKLLFTIDPISDSLLLKVITAVSVTNAKAKKKILVKYENSGIDSRIVIEPAEASKKIISLGRTDVYKLYSVVDENGQDITDNYIFDDGQRDNIYDISSLVLKTNRPAATTRLYITCDAFDHTSDGDFFSVDSYTHQQGIDYKKIPVYAQTTAIPDQQRSKPPIFVELRDCIDFRPSVNTLAPFSSSIPGISGVDSQNAKNFRDTSQSGNGVVPRFLVPGSVFQCDIEYYLARIDSLFLDRTGELKLIQGIADLNPKAPDDQSTGIRLYDLRLPPYTFSAEDIYIKKYNYRRYTMKDISDLDKRLGKVEDYVSLSLLEQSALNTTVRDAVTGLDRFKNGFVVDSFRDHSNGNTISDEYRCSIDPKSDHLRAPHFTEQVALEEINQLDFQRSNNAYRKTGPIFSLPYTSIEYIKNPFATRTVNLQPFSVFVYDGEVTLDPSVDSWQEVRRRDKLVIEDNSLYNAMVDMTDSLVSMGLGTVWGDWETTSTRLIPGGTISFAEAQRRGLTIQDGGGSLPFTWRPVNVSDTTVLNQQREEFRLAVNPNTSTTVQTSQGDRIVDIQIAKTMRTTPVFFQAYRLKPNTKYYAFFDGVDVNAWVSPDHPEFIPEDNSYRFVSAPNTNPKGFGQDIISDNSGTITGVFLVPNGFSPVSGSIFNGDLSAVQYNTNSIPRNFDVGTRSFRLTTNSTNGDDVDAYGESGFTSSGVILDRQETVVSTRVPSVERISTGRIQTNQITTQAASAVAFDPVAQTFLVDENSPDGVFVTELDVFFNTKDDKESVLAYLVTTDGQVPTEQILPFSMVEKKPDSVLRVVCELGSLNSETINAGTIVVGATSGARGIVKNAVTFTDVALDSIRNTANTVYNVILSNYSKEFIPGEAIVPEIAPASNSKFTIVQDEIAVTRVDIKKLGENYTTATISFSPPELPGGTLPSATPVISKGQIVKIIMNDFGSGYTNIPTAVVNGNGSGAELSVRVRGSRNAVEMGVATSEDASAATTFRFQAPVYLLGNTNYAFVLKSPNSIEYKAFISKLGENIIGTNTRVVHQPLLGSIFRSQNGGLWTEDQTEDVMFTLRRAEFVTNTKATINLENSPLGFESMDIDPVETNATPGNSDNFGNNPRIIRFYKKTHGNFPGDNVLVEGIIGYPNDINGIPVTEINGIHTVIAADFNSFTVMVNTAATSSGKAGGTQGKCSFNRPFEVINLRSGSLLFKNTSTSTIIRSAGCAGITGQGVSPYTLSNPVDSPIEISYYFNNPQQCAHYLNEAKYSGRNFLQGRRSLNATINLLTSDSKISPIFDYDRTNAVLAHSLIDNPKPSDLINGAPTITLTYDGDAASDLVGGFNLLPNEELVFSGGSVLVDEWNNQTRKLKVRGPDSTKITTSTILSKQNPLTPVLPTLVRVSSVNYPYFVPETQQNGSTFAKWISREFRLENASDGLEVKMTGIMYENDSIKLYYRVRDEGFDGNLVDINWIPFNGTGLCNNNDQIKVRSSDIIDPRQFVGNDFTEFTWSAQNISQFVGFSIKIVLTASNPGKIPIIDDFRAIATE